MKLAQTKIMEFLQHINFMVFRKKKQPSSISSWNVHGLGDKIDDPFFLNNIKSDINILLETWKGECEEFKVKGFNLISKCRKKKKGSRRYISSTHFENDFIMLDHELSTLSNRGKILVIGDLNSRTGELPDYIKNDSLQINNFDGSDLLPPDYAIDIENKRINQDKVLNTHGKNLLDLCLSSGLRIVNGSTVDYALVSESLWSSVQYFKTNDFTYLSDHAKIDLFLKCSINENTEFKLDNNKWKSINTYKWTEQSKNLVINALSTDYIREEIISLEILDINKTQDGVDEAVEKLTDILQNISEIACKKFFGSNKKKKEKRQPWSDNVIYETKREINSIGNKIKNNPINNHLKQKYFSCKNLKRW
ncbi:unnamed protein product [Mytilus edulis]|uniref:Endonuclease/exonuclease/phosphatase domain-containing protein n=1 Tax=Mytilus edulis TaxID=6550 RepID=A0A8S3TEB2_MYTED|nr:unnamed protein product [Mytilus edulis]